MLFTVVVATKVVAIVAEKALAPIANENRALSIAHRVVSGVNQVSVKDLAEVLPLIRKRKQRLTATAVKPIEVRVSN